MTKNNNQYFLVNAYHLAFITYLQDEKISLLKTHVHASLLKQIFIQLPDLPQQISRLNPLDAKNLIQDVFASFLGQHLTRFLLILVDDFHFLQAKEINDKVIANLESLLSWEKGEIYSPISLKSKQIAIIEQKISKLQNTKVILKNKIDADLIGGVRVEVGSLVWDNSLLRQLKLLNQELIS